MFVSTKLTETSPPPKKKKKEKKRKKEKEKKMICDKRPHKTMKE